VSEVSEESDVLVTTKVYLATSFQQRSALFFQCIDGIHGGYSSCVVVVRCSIQRLNRKRRERRSVGMGNDLGCRHTCLFLFSFFFSFFLFFFCFLFFNNNHQSSIINHQSSIINHQFPFTFLKTMSWLTFFRSHGVVNGVKKLMNMNIIKAGGLVGIDKYGNR
jgi:hypothetical protein